MSRANPALLAALAAAITLSPALPGATGAAGHADGLWLGLHACARLVAVWGPLLGLVTVGLAASGAAAALVELVRQAIIGRRAMRAAAACCIQAPAGLAELAGSLGVRRLVVCESAEPLAFCAGLLRPHVVVSTGTLARLDDAALGALLAHEASHARRRDPLRQVLAATAARAAWVLPAAATMADHGRLRHELRADREAMSHRGRKALARALLALHAPRADAPPALAGAAVHLGARVDALCGDGPPPLQLARGELARTVLGAVLVSGLVAGAVLAPPVPAQPLVPMPMDASASLEMAASLGVRALAAVTLWIGVRTVLGRRPRRRRGGRSPRAPLGESGRDGPAVRVPKAAGGWDDLSRHPASPRATRRSWARFSAERSTPGRSVASQRPSRP